MSPDEWFNLAWQQQRERRHEEALASYGEALSMGVERPEEAHLNRAAILADLGRDDDAEREFEAALAPDGRFVPAWVNLGNLHEQRGDRERARFAYEQALAIEPEQPLALSRLPDLKAIEGAGDPLIARLKEAIERAGASAADRADLGFGLGKALDKVGAYDDAFAAYAAANRASRVSAGPGGARYDAAAQERFVDRLIDTFPAPATASATVPGEPERIFICGMFRSGSSLVEQILASHPRVSAGGELDLIPALAQRHFSAALVAWPPLDAATLRRLRSAYAGEVAKRLPDAGVVTDKRPDNFLWIGLIKAMFPAAKIIHTRRDPLDNCLAVHFLHLAHAMPYALDLLDTAHWYGQYRRLMAHWTSLHGDAIHDIDYDELVAAPRPVIERLLAFCGLPWDDACLQFDQTRTSVRTPSAWQVREPIYTRSSGRWRHYERHLVELRAALTR
jgi:tetratricopeptide (TPR) repeat protein